MPFRAKVDANTVFEGQSSPESRARRRRAHTRTQVQQINRAVLHAPFDLYRARNIFTDLCGYRKNIGRAPLGTNPNQIGNRLAGNLLWSWILDNSANQHTGQWTGSDAYRKSDRISTAVFIRRYPHSLNATAQGYFFAQLSAITQLKPLFCVSFHTGMQDFEAYTAAFLNTGHGLKTV